MDKIIIARGNGLECASFWQWRVCYEFEFSEEMKDLGWHRSTTEKYLTYDQLEWVNIKPSKELKQAYNLMVSMR